MTRMNNAIKSILASLLCVMAASCGELTFGDKFLGEAPESSGATLETMFSSQTNAEQVLTRAYTGLMYGLPEPSDNRMGINILESITDLSYSTTSNVSDGPKQLYYNGALSPMNIPGYAAYVFGSETDWTTIRYAWTYIENVDRVPDMTAEQKELKKAEAKVLIALSYFNMMRYVGGFPYIDHAVSVDETLYFPRRTFAESVDIIKTLLDEAIPALTWKWNDANDGRMSSAAAMALKFKLLHWAASPTFNSDTKWNAAADEYTCYGNYDRQRWVDAQNAGREFFDAVAANGGYGLIQPTAATHQARREAFRQAYYRRGGTEVLISVRKGTDAATVNSSLFEARALERVCPTLNYVNMFPWEDGSDFPADFDWSAVDWTNPHKAPFFTVDEKGAMTHTRDPRLYESVAVPGDTYFNGNPAPVFTTKANESVKGTGFWMMKFILHEASERAYFVHWPHTRLTEIMLGYAEVLNEVNDGPTAAAYDMINQVRARVGLSALGTMNKEQFTEAVLRERALELGFEEVRWFDLVRRNRVDDFRKKLYGLISMALDDQYNPTTFAFSTFELTDRYWVSNWNSKWYLAPIPQNEINKNYGMTQNPGW